MGIGVGYVPACGRSWGWGDKLFVGGAATAVKKNTQKVKRVLGYVMQA